MIYDMIWWYDIWYDTIRYGIWYMIYMIWYDIYMIYDDMIYDTIRYDTILYDMVYMIW